MYELFKKKKDKVNNLVIMMYKTVNIKNENINENFQNELRVTAHSKMTKNDPVYFLQND